MIFTTAGVGPGDPELVTLKAIRALKDSDLVLIPISAAGRESVAESVVAEHIRDVPRLTLIFPMTKDADERDEKLREQLEASRTKWEDARRITMPVIGDAALYATSAYLYDVLAQLVPSLELEIVPGISAHAAISTHVGRFLALGDDILTIIPGTGDTERTARAMSAADTVALFKPIALRDALRETVERAGPWRTMLRIDRAGLPDENIVWGDKALDTPDEYLSTLMLWR